MPFDVTTAQDLAALQAHLASADTVKALPDALKNRADAHIADWYNTVQPTLAISRGVILRSTFVGDCQRLGVWVKLMQLQSTKPAAFAAWVFYLDKVLPLLDSFDVSGATMAALLPQLKADGLLDDAGIAALTTRPGTPAEALFGAGTVVDTSAISKALGSTEVLKP